MNKFFNGLGFAVLIVFAAQAATTVHAVNKIEQAQLGD